MDKCNTEKNLRRYASNKFFKEAQEPVVRDPNNFNAFV